MNDLRSLPSVDKLLRRNEADQLIGLYGRQLTLAAIRTILDSIRQQMSENRSLPDEDEILSRVSTQLAGWVSPTLQPVINASGVILHTNLGRAPLSASAQQAMVEAASGYSTLEYDLERGKRGSREIHAQNLLTRLTGAEAALVVNNNAAAVLLVLTALARRRAVVISRTQLIEIGGGFRLPEVMKQSGARLVEVGTTNRVHLQDYTQALVSERPALVLHAHHSNFRLVGFTAEPDLPDLVGLAHQHDVALVDDLGSGALLDTSRYGLVHEPTVQESLLAGVDIVCFSGDKLLGGPQAGIIVGRKVWLDKIKRHPLMRPLRSDKLCLAALSATLLHYLKGEAEDSVPVWQMISRSLDEIRTEASIWQQKLGLGEIISGYSTVGGGSLPGETLPTWLLALQVEKPDRLLRRLRQGTPPIIARIQDARLVLDPRTVLPGQAEPLLAGVKIAVDSA